MRKGASKYELPLIEIQWVDAETTYGWENIDESDHELPIVTTVGFLIKHTVDQNGNGVYVVASTYGDGGAATNSRIKIPKGMVVKETYLYMPKMARETAKAIKNQLKKLSEESSLSD